MRVAAMIGSQREFLEAAGCPSRIVTGGEDHLLRRWDDLVNSLVDGEVWEEDAYLEVLDDRGILGDLIHNNLMSEAGRMRLAITDDRFTMNTSEVEQCVWGLDNAIIREWSRDVHWWYWRVPKTDLV